MTYEEFKEKYRQLEKEAENQNPLKTFWKIYSFVKSVRKKHGRSTACEWLHRVKIEPKIEAEMKARAAMAAKYNFYTKENVQQ